MTVWVMSSVKPSATYSDYDASVPDTSPTSATEVLASTDKIVDLQSKIDALDKRLTALTKGGLRQLNKPVLNDALAKNESLSTQQDGSNKVFQQHLIQTANRFQLEETDIAWAKNIEVSIQNAFYTSRLAESSSLNNVICHTSMCKLEVSIKNSSGMDNVEDILMNITGELLPYGSMKPGTSNNEVVIYLSKQSETLMP